MIKDIIKKLLSFFLGIFFLGILFFGFASPAYAQLSCFDRTVKVTTVTQNISLPSPGDTVTVRVRATNNCDHPTGRGFKMDNVFDLVDANGNFISQSFFTIVGEVYELASDVPAGFDVVHEFSTTIKSGDTCVTSGKIRATAGMFTGIIGQKSQTTESGTATAGTTDWGIGAVLKGTIRKSDGTAASGAKVTISPADYSAGTVTADSSGNYQFSRLNCNIPHTLSASLGGESASKGGISVQSGELCNGQERTIDLTTQPGTTPTPPPGATPPPGTTPTPTPTPTPPPGGGGACGELISGRLDSPTAGSTVTSPVKFSGQYWDQPGKCGGFQVNPNLSYVKTSTSQFNFISSEIGAGFFNKTINLSPGTYNVLVHVEGWCPVEQRNGVVELPIVGASCGSANITVTQPPPAAWLPPTCTNTSFSGCSLQGNSRCSDWGSSSYPNWDNSLWNDCQKTCTQPNPDNFCLANIPP